MKVAHSNINGSKVQLMCACVRVFDCHPDNCQCKITCNFKSWRCAPGTETTGFYLCFQLVINNVHPINLKIKLFSSYIYNLISIFVCSFFSVINKSFFPHYQIGMEELCFVSHVYCVFPSGFIWCASKQLCYNLPRLLTGRFQFIMESGHLTYGRYLPCCFLLLSSIPYVCSLSSPAWLYCEETESGSKPGRRPDVLKTRWNQKKKNACKSQ